MNKKRIVLLFGLLIILIGWWMLNRDLHPQPEAGVIDVWVTWGESPDRLQSFFDRYSRDGDVLVRVTTQVRSDDLVQSLDAEVQPDVVILSSADLVADYHARGLLESLSGRSKPAGINTADMYEASLLQCQTPDGDYFCLPWGSEVDALYWNKDLFAAAGLDPDRPPETMEELVQYAKQLTRRNELGELTQVGFIPDFPRSHLEMYTGLLGDAFGQEQRSELISASPSVDGALNWQQQIYAEFAPWELPEFVDSITPYWTSSHPIYAGRMMSCQQCHRSHATAHKKIPDRVFFDGHVAMMLDGPWHLNNPAHSQVNYGVAPFPPPEAYPERSHSSVVGGPVVIVPAGAEDEEAAMQLIAWMMTPEVVADAAYANGNLPSSRAAATDPRFQQDPDYLMFMELIAHPNAIPLVTMDGNADDNETLAAFEKTLLHEGE